MTSQLPPIPPSPADTTHPRRALARLALSSAYREAADFAASGVPTVSDEYGDAVDYVDHVARLVSMAQDVLVRGGPCPRSWWDDIAEALNLTAEQARNLYTAAIEQWEDALNRPWQRSGRFMASRMPDGTTESDETAADLDQWRLRHLEDTDGARHNARRDGTEDRMVSANLPEHTPLTEMNSLTRSAGRIVDLLGLVEQQPQQPLAGGQVGRGHAQWRQQLLESRREQLVLFGHSPSGTIHGGCSPRLTPPRRRSISTADGRLQDHFVSSKSVSHWQVSYSRSARRPG